MNSLRNLPAVDELARAAGVELPHALVVNEARAVLDELRARLLAGEENVPDANTELQSRLKHLLTPSLRRVINATGVILHTNLGRAPLPDYQSEPGYSNLEYDLATGRRGRRDAHTGALLERLLGAPAIAVNNGAAAVLLALHELAGGGEALISRGELVEIGDGFRISEICAHSGATLVEVGATNRTHIDDYRAAITPRTRLILRVHPSNFRIEGFSGRPALSELCALGLPVYEDLGSGCLVDLRPYGIDEPTIGASLEAGVQLVSCSGDKLLGGPQAGLLAGRGELVERLRRNPLYRALRLDKLVVGALETTLRHLLLNQYDEIPVLRMIARPLAAIAERAERLARAVPGAEVVDGFSLIGGGSTPGQTLPTRLVAIRANAVALERRLRLSMPPVIARIDDDQLLIDLRTVEPGDDAALLAALAAAHSAG
jgi:L-seryl-tRNA(Ser) seleniumtransferase